MSEQRKWFAPGGEQTGKGGALAEAPLKKKIRGLLALGLCLCLGLGLLPAPALAADPTTTWTDAGNFDTSWYVGHESDTEFTLTTAAELAGLASLANSNDFSGKTVKLGADVDLSAHLWNPIGPWNKPFSGTFDGGWKTVSGMIVSGDGGCGFFEQVGTGGTVHSLRIKDAAVTSDTYRITGGTGILAGRSAGAIYDCAVSGSVKYNEAGSSDQTDYVGGLAGGNTGTIKNCSAHLTSLTATLVVENGSSSCRVGGIAGEGTVENCFADVDSATVTASGGTSAEALQYRLAPVANDSYWDATTALTDGAAPNAPTYTRCYAVTAEQIAGTSTAIIGAGSTHANTPSLVTALNNWAAANTGYGAWGLSKDGTPMLDRLIPPIYIDIGVVPEQSKDSAAGTLDADVQLHGQVQKNVELLSVTLPASIPFILDVDRTGALNRVLSGTGTLTNRSDMGVTVTLTSVTDPDDLLTKADLSLVPAPLPAGGNVALSVGTGKTDVLSTLAAQTAGVPATSTLKVDGAAKASVPSVGSDGDSFTVGLTLKVSKT